jgi:hypothetical protein
VKPEIKSCAIKTGEITCAPIDSSYSIKNSEGNEKLENLDSEILVSEAIIGVNESKSEFGFSAEIKQSQILVKGRIVLRFVYGVAAIDFDPGRRTSSISTLVACKICCNA